MCNVFTYIETKLSFVNWSQCWNLNRKLFFVILLYIVRCMRNVYEVGSMMFIEYIIVLVVDKPSVILQGNVLSKPEKHIAR